MSDPHYRDPRMDPAPIREEDIRGRRMSELDQSNAMWGWIAGAVVLALVLVFVFASGQSTTDTASNVPTAPPAATGSSPPRQPALAPATQVPRPSPSTTGQGTAR